MREAITSFSDSSTA
jgi:hypothetical protein